MKIVYLDCFSGISGDMALAALTDAGADRSYIESELAKIDMEPFALEWKRVIKRGIASLKVDVRVVPGQEPHHHRHYSDIVRMIQNAGFNERVTEWSLAMFESIGRAEAKIHDVPLERVHFHEVGAIDSIVDVIGIALALDSLDADYIGCAPVPLGYGTVRCDHGIYPVPAPATLEMMKGIPVAPSHSACELTTPTGAGVVSAIVEGFSSGVPRMTVEAVGYGAGSRDLPERPNVLRVIVGQAENTDGLRPRSQRPEKVPALSHSHENSDQPEHGHAEQHSHGHEHAHVHSGEHSHVNPDENLHSHGHPHEHSHSHPNEHSHEHSHPHEHRHGADRSR